MAHNIEHSIYKDIYKEVELADKPYTASFDSKVAARRFTFAARWYINYNGLGWKVSINLFNVTITKSTANGMTVGLLINKLKGWDNETLVDVAITDEDGNVSWYTIADIEELDEKSDKEHMLLYIGDCVML